MKYLEWLKSQLGEELFNKHFPTGSDILKTVTDKLGEKKIIEDDGKLVPYHRFEEVNKKLNDPETGLTAVTAKMTKLQSDYDALKDGKGGDKTLEDKFKTLEEKYTKLENTLSSKDKELIAQKKSTALDSELVAAKANPKYMQLIKKEFDLEKLELDDNGKIKGFADLLKPVQENFKDLFGEIKFVGGDPSHGGDPKAVVEMSANDFYEKEVFKTS